MSIAKKAVDSTLKRILIYTGEIIASIILLVIICLPLAFSVPMWIQRVGFDTPVNELLVNPVAWFGYVGFLLVIAVLAVFSIILGYPFLLKLIPGKDSDQQPVVEEEDEEEEFETGLDEEAEDIEGDLSDAEYETEESEEAELEQED